MLLGDDLDKKVQMYLKKVREGGGVVSARIAMAAARGIVLTCDRSLLVEFGGHVELSILTATSYEVCAKEGHHRQKQAHHC